jgi:hypothetical protein
MTHKGLCLKATANNTRTIQSRVLNRPSFRKQCQGSKKPREEASLYREHRINIEEHNLYQRALTVCISQPDNKNFRSILLAFNIGESV